VPSAPSQTAQVVQRNLTIITGSIVLIAFAWRTFREPEPRYFITMWFGTPMKGTGKFSYIAVKRPVLTPLFQSGTYVSGANGTSGYSHSGQHFQPTCRTK
jgi:hypothetical protein